MEWNKTKRNETNAKDKTRQYNDNEQDFHDFPGFSNNTLLQMMFRIAQHTFRLSQQLIRRPLLCSSTLDIRTKSENNSFYYTQIGTRTYLSDAYQAFDKWDKALSSEILQKTNISKGNHRKMSSTVSLFCILGELLIDVEDQLNRKKYVTSLDIEIVSSRQILAKLSESGFLVSNTINTCRNNRRSQIGRSDSRKVTRTNE